MSSKQSRSSGTVIAAVVLGIAAVAAVIAVAVTGGDNGDGAADGLPSTADVTVDGQGLPRLEDPAADPAVGMPAPGLTGQDFDGSPVDLPADGEPTVVVFLAHWCPACQSEVPQVQRWIDEGGQPEGVALRAVSTGVDSGQANYPPGSWLDEEGWTVPTVLDDSGSTAGQAFGLPGYPYWVFVTADGIVAGRHVGVLPVEGLEQIMIELAELSR